MAILRLTDATTRRALLHPAIRDRARIGRGAFCMVFDNGQSVFKLTCDPFQYHFYTHDERPQGEYFPTLIRDFGAVGGTDKEPLYLVEMEKLGAFQRKATAPREAWEQRRNLHKAIGHHRRKVWMMFDGDNAESEVLIACLRGTQEYKFVEAGLTAAASRLADFCERMACSPDLHRSNFMLRGAQLVLNDVVKDQQAIYRRDLLKLMPPEAADAYLERKKQRAGLAITSESNTDRIAA